MAAIPRHAGPPSPSSPASMPNPRKTTSNGAAGDGIPDRRRARPLRLQHQPEHRTHRGNRWCTTVPAVLDVVAYSRSVPTAVVAWKATREAASLTNRHQPPPIQPKHRPRSPESEEGVDRVEN